MLSKSVNIAYVLLVHKNYVQVNILIKQLLKDENAMVYVHIDKKGYEVMIGNIIKHPRVTILKKSISASWGDISLVDATILLFREVIASGIDYDFVSLKSGQDLVVKQGYNEYLASHINKSFMTALKIERSDSYASCLEIKWPSCTRRLYDSAHPFRILRALLKRLYGIGINLLPNKGTLPKKFKL